MWYRVALSSIGEAVIMTDRKGSVSFMNPPAQILTGWNENYLGKDLPDVFNLVDFITGLPKENPFITVMREGVNSEMDGHCILIRKNGTEVPIEANFTQIRDEDGNIDGIILVSRNISDRRTDIIMNPICEGQSPRSDLCSKDLLFRPDVASLAICFH